MPQVGPPPRGAIRLPVSGFVPGVFLSLITAGLFASTVWAAEPEPTPVAEPDSISVTGAPAKDGSRPGLDALLKLPNQYRAQPAPAVAGTSETQWRNRFSQAVGAVNEARAALQETKLALDGIASSGGSSQWAVTPPGGSAGNDTGAPTQSNSPVSFKLRQQLRANRQELDEAERELRELSIQADLAGVPATWRGVMPETESPSELGQLLD